MQCHLPVSLERVPVKSCQASIATVWKLIPQSAFILERSVVRSVVR